MTVTHSLRTIADLEPGDHLCCIYETEEEHRAVLTPFLRRGLERGEKVVYIVDARTAEAILGYLRDPSTNRRGKPVACPEPSRREPSGQALDVESYLASGQLTILTRDDAYMRQGVFDPEGMIALLKAETEQALAEGYPALRVTGEMTWALRGLPGSERLIEYETKMNEFFPGSRCLAICQYDRRRFAPEVLLDVLRTHPTAIVGTEMYDNFYYMPPDEIMGGNLPAAELRRWVQNLAERKRAEEALRQRQKELIRLNRLLEDSNRGLLALYVEMDERADELRRAAEWKSRALSEMSHEFRTPLSSILSLSRILLDRVDGDLTAEQEKQVALIHKSAQGLLGMINDLLDMAKAKAGKTALHMAHFEVTDLFSSLRGMMGPLNVNPAVALIFEEPAGIPPFHTDQIKVAQILRNLVSNALKFTPRGEVRVSAKLDPEGKAVAFSVADTGIGIKPQDQELIFEEFVQVAAPVQKGVEGTGLGLALSKRLAELLGGSLSVESQPGVGSTFTALVPLVYAGADTKLPVRRSSPK
jgi:signal transduction histidine kinase